AGTVFYVRKGNESSIYVLYNGKKITAIKSWDGTIEYYKCFGDALCFKTDTKKIYTATFHPPNDLRINFIRKLNGESCLGNMLIRKKINEKEVIYRPCDDPKKGIIVDVEKEKLRGFEMRTIHR
ncbi:hypothetical protein PFISCL1PPCAC_8492, partial [Pristionchus fissidentatus]